MLGQIRGFFGTHGIMPASLSLEWMRQNFSSTPFNYPTLAWLNSSDWFLILLDALGIFLSALLAAGFTQFKILFSLWILLLSLANASGIVYRYLWDQLLLETGFLSLFLYSWKKPPRAALWALRFLFFRVMFSMGWVKLTSNHPLWHNFMFLKIFYQNQPCPSFFAWFLYQMPDWFHQLSSLITLIVEVPLPFLIFAPDRLRNWRIRYFYIHAFFQLMIFISGNYAFFQPLMLALSLLLLDDQSVEKWTPRHVLEGACAGVPQALRLAINLFLGFTIFCASFWIVHIMVRPASVAFCDAQWLLRPRADYVPRPGMQALRLFLVLGISRPYDLFSHLPQPRYEINVVGSRDGKSWQEYDFLYKPQNTENFPRWYAPYQSRLDHMMYYQAMAFAYPETRKISPFLVFPWFESFLRALLDNQEAVISLLRKNPFPGAPPAYVRADLYEYEFTNLGQLRLSGQWWRKHYVRELLTLRRGG